MAKAKKKQEEKLTPPDLKRCQAMKPNGHNFMTLGGRPGLERCTAAPTVLLTETKPPKGSKKCGSMSVCTECLVVAHKQLGSQSFTMELIK